MRQAAPDVRPAQVGAIREKSRPVEKDIFARHLIGIRPDVVIA
jgi:hypothetical protein